MSNLPQAYNWENQFEEPLPFPRPLSDEVISIYEVYVKEENPASSMKNNVTMMPGLNSNNEQQLMQVRGTVQKNPTILRVINNRMINRKGDCMDIGVPMNSELANMDTGKFPTKDPMKYKGVSGNEENVVMYSHPISEGPSSTTRLIDKDDPRSRLHFVKYLKRDGKTLKIWECGICSKEFRHQYTLMRHLPTHTDERNFKCEACGKAFRQLSTLSQHKAIHSDARPYVCEFCKKTFNRVSTLISHRKTHSEHKPHKCQICGKGFHQKGNLRNHVFTHTNERPYKCELCGKGFNQMSNLVCHKVKAHAHAEKMQYVCGICGKEFPRRFSLRSHEEYKHGIKYRQPSNHQTTINETGVIRNKSVRIVQLPSVDRNQVVEVKDKDPLVTSDYVESVVIDKIETKAMEMTLLEGQTPFALFKPAKGIPVLVKVSSSGTHKHMLTPATPEDLRRAGKISLTPPVITSTPDGSKTFQVKVPVVATVIQNIDADGKANFLVEAPGPDNEQESLVTALDSQFTYGEPGRNEPDHQDVSAALSPPMEACNELLELAAQGGIQFVRATEDGRYEVMSNSEARELMAQNSHDVTILDGEEADAINVVNIRGNGDMIIGEPENQIMVLDGSSPQKSMSIDGIEIFEDKDIRILESKSLDERFSDGILFSQSKLDDLILGQKALGIDDSVGATEHEDQGRFPMGLPVSPGQQELANLLGHRSDMPPLCGNPSIMSQSSMSSLLLKNHTPLSMLNDTLPYLKNNSSLVDDFGLLTGGIDDHHLYESKMKLPVFDETETDAGLISINPPDLKLLGSSQSMKLAECLESGYPKMPKSCQPAATKFFPSFGDMKLLSAKSSQELMGPVQYQDMKLFSPYEQFLKNMATNTNGCEMSASEYRECEYKKDGRSPGKKLGILGENEPASMEIVGEKVKTEFFYATYYGHPNITALEHQQRALTNYCNYHSSMVMNGAVDFCTGVGVEGGMLTSPRLPRQMPESGSSGPDSFLLQACSPCDSDFLSFEARLKDSSPGGHFDGVHKDCRDAFNNPTGLPDLD